jgi:hypothetical protein
VIAGRRSDDEAVEASQPRGVSRLQAGHRHTSTTRSRGIALPVEMSWSRILRVDG